MVPICVLAQASCYWEILNITWWFFFVFFSPFCVFHYSSIHSAVFFHLGSYPFQNDILCVFHFYLNFVDITLHWWNSQYLSSNINGWCHIPNVHMLRLYDEFENRLQNIILFIFEWSTELRTVKTDNSDKQKIFSIWNSFRINSLIYFALIWS